MTQSERYSWQYTMEQKGTVEGGHFLSSMCLWQELCIFFFRRTILQRQRRLESNPGIWHYI